METILNSALWRLFRWLPHALLRRIFQPEWFMSHLEIDVRSRNRAVEIVYQPNSESSVRVYLSIRNETHFEVEVDRIVLKFFYGAEMADFFYFRREVLSAREQREIFLEAPINSIRAASLPFQHAHNSSRCELHVLAECNSDVHKFRIESRLEGIKPEIMNEEQLRNSGEQGIST